MSEENTNKEVQEEAVETVEVEQQESSAPMVESQGVEDKTVPEQTPVQAAEPVVVETAAPAALVAGNPVESYIAQCKTMAGKIALQTVGDYMDAMRPKKPIAAMDGARNQVSLYRTICTIINQLDDDFNHVFSSLLKLFNDYQEGVFHEIYVFRFMEHVALSEQDRKAFLCLLNLLKVTAAPQGRQVALRQVDMGKTLAYGITEQGKQKVLAFFNL